MKIKKIILSVIVFIILVYGIHLYWQQKLVLEERKAAWLDLGKDIESRVRGFNGQAGIVIKDLSTGWELSYNKEKLFPAASLTKVPIMAACFLASEQGRLPLDKNVALKPKDKLTGSGVLKAKPAGSLFSVRNLIGLMVYDSDNTAANILTDMTGMEYLNRTFKSFGLKNTDLSRKIADYRLRDRGIENYTTAEDMALLLENIYRKKLCDRYVSEECLNMMKLTRSNDRIPKYIPDNIIIAHKTGLERQVCHDAGIVFTPKGDFLIIVLTKHGKRSNSFQSKGFIASIALLAYNHFSGLS